MEHDEGATCATCRCRADRVAQDRPDARGTWRNGMRLPWVCLYLAAPIGPTSCGPVYDHRICGHRYRAPCGARECADGLYRPARWRPREEDG